MTMTMQKSQLCCLALGVSMGLVTGCGMMALAWAGLYFHYGLNFITQLSSLYMGYDYSLIGGLVGFGWGFFEGFIAGILIGCIYNIFVSGCKSCYVGDPEEQ